MMECKCHKGQEPLSAKQAVVFLLKSMSAKPTSEQVQWLIDFMGRSEVKGYLDRSCVFIRTMAEYCKGKSLNEIVSDENLYDNINRYYWENAKVSDDEVARAMEEIKSIKKEKGIEL